MEIRSFFSFNVFLIGFAFGRFEGPMGRRFSVTSVEGYTGPR